jgi:hypothetical protein
MLWTNDFLSILSGARFYLGKTAGKARLGRLPLPLLAISSARHSPKPQKCNRQER